MIQLFSCYFIVSSFDRNRLAVFPIDGIYMLHHIYFIFIFLFYVEKKNANPRNTFKDRIVKMFPSSYSLSITCLHRRYIIEADMKNWILWQFWGDDTWSSHRLRPKVKTVWKKGWWEQSTLGQNLVNLSKVIPSKWATRYTHHIFAVPMCIKNACWNPSNVTYSAAICCCQMKRWKIFCTFFICH